MAKLSVLYVVRNEADLIEKSFASVQPIADEIIVVDTGSFDKTLQTCRKFHYVRVFGHTWMHDYSQTKNFGIKHCTGDWILSMDADEMLDPTSATTIRTAVDNAKANVAAFGVRIIDHETALDYRAPTDNTSFFGSPQVRLFRRHKGIVFEGKVMEGVSRTAKAVGGIDVLDATVHHFLWRNKGDEYKQGRLRYYKQLGANIQPEKPREIEQPVPAAQTAIVVVAHNVLAATKECVGAISRNTPGAHELCLVDNGSNDGTLEYMKGLGITDPVTFATNTGVAHGRNMGARRSLGDPATKYLCFLDNDAKVSEGWLSAMIKVLEADPKVGMVGPLSNNADGPQNIYEMPGSNNVLTSREPEYFFVDSISRFCMLVTTEMARKVGLFDESLGIYGCEEKDLCIRAKQAGYEIAIANRAYVEHRGRATILENKMDWHKLVNASTAKFMQKWTTLPATTGPRSPETVRAIARTPYPKLSFVILTHNRLDVTKDCINSILGTCSNFELVLVDNGSTDNTAAWVRSIVPGATIIQNEKNLGVPMARNQGVKATTGEYLVVMDNDIVLHAGWLDDMFGPIRDGADMVGIEGWQLDHNHAAIYQCTQPNERFDYLGGALTVIRRKVFETIGLYDEGFSPAYYEDVDFSVRARRAAMKLSWVQTSKIHHRQHATLVYGQKEFKYQEALGRSYGRFAAKMRGEIKVEHERLPAMTKKLNIIYAAMQYDYGVRERGTSFEHDNFYPAFMSWDKAKITHFDFVDLGQQHGVPQMTEMLYNAVLLHKPDAIFTVFFDEAHDPRREVFDKIRKNTSTKVVSWFCDSHYRYENFDQQWAPHVDFCVTTSTDALQKYRRDGLGAKVIKSQWAAAPNYSYDPNATKDIAVSFVGQPHGDRRQVIARLRSAGVDVQTYGNGWGQRLTFPQMINVFNRSRINLNLNNGADARHKQIKGRNFEVPGCGGFLLTGTAENLFDYYKFGKEIAVFDSTEDLIRKVEYYLEHEDERAPMAKAGYERTMRDHTYAKRFDEIFIAAGLLKKE